MAKPSREVLLQCNTTIFQVLCDPYHNRKHTLNRLDKAIFEAASRGIARELMPRAQSTEIINEFDQELAEQKASVERARLERQKKKDGQPTSGAA